MESKAYFSENPQAVILEVHDDGNWVWMRKNIEEIHEEDGIVYSCDEVFFKTGASLEEIVEDFDAYYYYGTTWQEEEIPTIETRLSAVEDIILEMLG